VLGTGGSGYLNLLQATPPTPNDSIVLSLEEPAPGSVYSGIANVRGWAVAPSGLTRIELYVNSELRGTIPLGGRRSDVGAAYPTYPGSADAGFAMAFNYSGLNAGPHTLTVRAIDAAGGARDASAAFTVARFANAFMADPAAVNLDQATLTRSGNTITIQDLVAAGQRYQAQLTWRPAAQGFALTQIDSTSACAATLSPTGRTFPYSGGADTVAVAIPAGCAWTARSQVSWITITGGGSGNGSGTVTYTVQSNGGSSSTRTSTLTIAEQSFMVTQEGSTGNGI
jgi:hypothetical protein